MQLFGVQVKLITVNIVQYEHVEFCRLIGDPAPLKLSSLRGVLKLRKVVHCNKHYFVHILMQKWLLCDIPIKSYEMLNINM